MEYLVWLILVPFAGAFLLFAYGAGLVALAALSQWRALTAGQRWRLIAKLIGLVLFIAPLLVMVAFFVLSVSYGGSADGGKIEDGRYFLESHGNYVEVSRATWNWMSWHQTIAFPIGGPVCALGIAIMALLARLERKRPHCSVEELVAVESRAEAQANLGRICPRRSRAYWIGVSLTALAMMVVIDAATVVVLVEVGSIIRLLNLLFIPWFIAAVSSILAGLLWRRGRPALGMMLRVLGDLSLMYWVAGPIAFLFFVFCAALQQDLFMGALMGALLLAAVGGQFAFGADAAWLVAATLADQHPKQQSN